MEITWKGSPNYSNRPGKVKKIVIHWFGVGTLESANSRFQNRDNKTSAHYGISKGRIWQWVKESNVAWHAGNLAINNESIGIEHDAGINPQHDLSEQDYQLSAQLLAEISKRHNLPLNRSTVIGHGEVRNTQCPGTINIDRIIAIANEILKPIIKPEKPMFPIKWTRLIVANNVEQEKREQHRKEVDMADAWFKTKSAGRIEIESTIVYVNYTDIPMGDYGALNGNQTVRIVAPERTWFDQNVLAKSKKMGGHDEVCFYEEATDTNWILTPQGYETIQGLMFFNSGAYPRPQRTMQQTNLSEVIDPSGLTLTSIVQMHETSHALFWLYTSDDPTHALFYTENMKDAHLIFDRLDYVKLTAALAARRGTSVPPEQPKGDKMLVSVNHNGTIYTPVGEKWVGITRQEVFTELGGDFNQAVPVDDATFERVIKPNLATCVLAPNQ